MTAGRGRRTARGRAFLSLLLPLSGVVGTVAAGAAVLCGAMVPQQLAAQEATVLSLDDALERAVEFNPNYRRTINNLELSDIGHQQAWGAYLPRLNVSSSTGVGLNRQLIAFDEFGNPVENPVTEWRTTSSTRQSVNASLTLFQWGARSRDMEVQRALARSREATVTSQSRTLRADVIRAYRAAQNQAALLAVEASLLDSRQLDLETTQRMFELAGASRVDVLTAELEVQRQEQLIREAEGRLDQALLRLRTVVGDPDLTSFQVSELLPEAFDPSSLNPEALASVAFSSNPTLVEQEASLEVRRAEAQSARRSHWPGLTISFSANQSTFGDQMGAFAEPFPDRSRSGSAGFGITIPVFEGFTNKARIVQSEVALVNQEETLREARMIVDEEVQSRLIAVETAHQSYVITVTSREIAQERLRLGREQFRLGSRTFAELQQDIDAASQAERAVINQLFALEQALANLEEIVGEELR
ncbi:MAG: TolC family protein [Gemmatimonadetes bacterium]|nr:TolC family protein [Gemmatimonadota bacterium]NNM06870.1 TolC family protein [Gemmatimonadota bacterium]